MENGKGKMEEGRARCQFGSFLAERRSVSGTGLEFFAKQKISFCF